LSAAITIATLTLLLKAVTAAREMGVAFYFGTSDGIDAFLIAFLAPSFVINAPIAAFTAALMPTFIRVREHEGTAAAARLAGNGLAAALALLLACSLGLALFAQPIIRFLGSGFSPEKAALTIELFYLLLPVIVLSGLTRFWGTMINAGQRFALVSGAQLATPILTLALLLTIGNRGGVYILVAGVVGGAAIEVGLIMYAARRTGLPLRPRWHALDEPTRMVISQYLPAVFGTLLQSCMVMVDLAMAAMLASGSVASLSYGSKLIALVLALVAGPVGTAILPSLAELAARRRWDELRRTYLGWLGVLVVSTVPLTTLLVLLAQPLVRLAFERGAFTAADTALVAPILASYALQIPFYLVGTIGSRVLSALRFNGALAIIGGCNFILNLALNLILIQYMGLAGIALATSFVYAVSAVMITTLTWGRLGRAHAEAAATLGPPDEPRGVAGV
jgi:putative peptidoglycan lipid II flippase